MKSRLILYADKGKVLTDGETFCYEIQLAVGNDGSDFYEITQEEYDKIVAQQNADMGIEIEEEPNGELE